MQEAVILRTIQDADRFAAQLGARRLAARVLGPDELADLRPTNLAKRVLVADAGLKTRLAEQAVPFAEWCRKHGFHRVMLLDQAAAFAVQDEFNGAVLSVSGEPGAQRFVAELVCRFAADDQAVAAGDVKTFELLDLGRKVARSEVTVMIVGPTGAGKEVISRYLHAHSPRAKEPFIAVNCAAVPESMLEAMLFGYERGAFTGAHHPNKGIFRAADGGTLLLDEISEMTLQLQAKLLRVLQEKEVTPLGGAKAVPVDVRVIATSNRYMVKEVKAGRFRQDLYYRLNVFPIAIKALAERPGDILPIGIHLLAKHVGGFGRVPYLTGAAIDRLEDHSWPGNVRELENVLQRALVLSGGARIDADHLMLDPTEMEADGALGGFGGFGADDSDDRVLSPSRPDGERRVALGV